MKKTTILILFLAIIFGCSKTPTTSNTSGPTSGKGYISCKVDGQLFTTNFLIPEIDSSTGIIGFYGIADTNKGDSKGAGVYVNMEDYVLGNIVRVDSQFFFGVNLQFTGYRDQSDNPKYSYPSISGVVNITTATPKLFEGTFSYIGRNDSTKVAKNITEGKFSAIMTP